MDHRSQPSLGLPAVSPPGLSFFRFYPDAPAPRRCDPSAAGTLPTRAFRYCEAVRLASGWGYWLFAPLSFSVVWDGSEILWRMAGGDGDWELLHDSVHFPGFPAAWDVAAPRELSGLCPPFLTALPEPGLLQITLGIIPTMASGWLLYMRPAANFPGPANVEAYAGLIDLDAYRFGPLFANVRLRATCQPITVRADRPLVQVSAVPRWALADSLAPERPDITDLTAWRAGDWAGYQETITEPNARPDRAHGAYAARSRKLARQSGCPFAIRPSVAMAE